MKSGIMKFLGMAVWLITALVAVNVGLEPWGVDVLKSPSLIWYSTTLCYVILASGIISLLMFFMAFTGGRCDCCGGSK